MEAASAMGDCMRCNTAFPPGKPTHHFVGLSNTYHVCQDCRDTILKYIDRAVQFYPNPLVEGKVHGLSAEATGKSKTAL